MKSVWLQVAGAEKLFPSGLCGEDTEPRHLAEGLPFSTFDAQHFPVIAWLLRAELDPSGIITAPPQPPPHAASLGAAPGNCCCLLCFHLVNKAPKWLLLSEIGNAGLQINILGELEKIWRTTVNLNIIKNKLSPATDFLLVALLTEIFV